ncbi:alcohol dehydrogenase, catalytic domain protein, GroES-like family [Leptospira kirschneri str. 200803703]|uniref:Alcohol dehydrogenase, catalytic domain protein, GroES-like family n=1 Tax=Leptospira kirschneri str. 200802841 TaxID=1193047 RepID=A0A828Y9U0_9LEPT|nr:alcohol dehydrogenase catalytic domain-containing protein [Leptospira kirschneri]EKO52594.1 alcohol dehydrogenase, catalytic domain protein, GroES-like family [Leptospira kirschneri str. 200802841]EMO68205.1 alcohol dehydrogenase, catalytic domain protein, GroES-like family [Leptospira kirschneri str. 200803703]EMO75862.1 alcohol dehydrogenase, catalytic domain, GroES-like family [Leptospira kirschneri str. 200801925]
MKIEFSAMDYHSDETFEKANYLFKGSLEKGWEIYRNGKEYLRLGPGYKLLRTKLCGVCSTDLSRSFLPFPLPQVIGHEVVVEDMEPIHGFKQKYVVEINDTFEARGEKPFDKFCEEGIASHSPTRKVLGIDRLPGGFGPYILAPQNAVISYNNTLSDKVAVLIEPFAASLQAVLSSPPKNGDEVAVLGPRRLGSLVVAALDAFRNSSGIRFKISALSRQEHLLKLSLKLGADQIIDLRKEKIETLKKRYAIVYDTTGTTSGFESAIRLANRELHLKTTNGQEVFGIKKLTELVVDELSLLKFTDENLNFHWAKENRTIYVAPNAGKMILPSHFKVYYGKIEDAEKILLTEDFRGRIPRFDLGIAGTVEEIDLLIRPNRSHENSLIRPRGAILFQGKSEKNNILEFLNSGKSIRSSRCGNFQLAIKLLQENKKVLEALEKNMITHFYSPEELNQAFATAKSSESIKVVIQHF